jgi:hypothetical protein
LCVLAVATVACGGGEDASFVLDSTPSSTTDRDRRGPSQTTTSMARPQLGPWLDVTGNLAGQPSECGNLAYVGANPGSDQVVAGVALQGIWTNTPGSDEWTKLGEAGQIVNRTAAIVFDPAAPSRFWESGSYNGPGAFRSVNGGLTFEALGDLQHLAGISVDLLDPERQTLLAGSHERADLYRSTNGGATWTNLGPNLPPAIGYAGQPLVLDAQVHLVGTTGSEAAGIFRSIDGGTSWQRVMTVGAAGTPLAASDGSIYWPVAGGGLIRSTDGGVTWVVRSASGLSSHNVVELADGRIASLSDDHLIVSADQGLRWQVLGPPLPISDAYGLTYSALRNALFIWRWDCGEVVPSASVHRLDLTPTGS